MKPSNPSFHAGYVAIVGRPNVGKSSLLNAFLNQKLSITSHKPQTTRHTLLGIDSDPNGQIVFVDTPGVQSDNSKAMYRVLNKVASAGMEGVDLALFVIEVDEWNADDKFVLSRIDPSLPVILVVNKIDKLKDRSKLLPFLQQVSSTQSDGSSRFAAIVPISARKNDGLTQLREEILKVLPAGDAIFPEDQLTDRSERFLAAEIIREKIMRTMGQEVPYDVAVEIERYEEAANCTHIHGIIWVARKGQKGILIGKGGERLKRIGASARKELEILLQAKVNLKLWVKLKQAWSDDIRIIQSLGYGDHEK